MANQSMPHHSRQAPITSDHMADFEPPSDDPFEQLNPDKVGALTMPAAAPQAPPQPDPDDPFSAFPTAAAQPTSWFGAATRAAARGIAPALAGLAAAGPAAEAGAEIGSLAGPWGAGAGALIGGIGGMMLGGAVAEKAQDFALSKAPESWVEAIGQDDRQQRLDQTQHPYASFLGGLAPYALTMRPGAIAARALPENATAFQRIMANPVTARVFGGAAMGGMELGQEAAEGQPLDWRKGAIATGFGLIFNKPTRLGEAITELGARPVREAFSRASTSPALAEISVPPDVPPVQPGFIRFFHGGDGDPTTGGGRWVQAPQYNPKTRLPYPGSEEGSLNYARNYRGTADRTTNVWYVDVPYGDEEEIRARRWDQLDEDAGTNQVGYYGSTELPERLAKQMKLYEAGRAREPPPTVAQAGDMKVMGPGITEDVFRGAHEQEPSAAMAAQDARRTEITLTEPPPLPDIYDVARQMHPETFARHDELLARRDTLETWLGSEHGPDPALIRTNTEIATLAPDIAAAYRRAADKIGAPNAEAVQPPPPQTAPGSAPSVDDQRATIAADVARQMVAAGQPEPVAQAYGAMMADYYARWSQRMGGVLGTPQEFYAREGARIVGRGATAQRQAPPRQPLGHREQSLFEYLASHGGLRDDPEVRAVIGDNPFIPGSGRLIRREGSGMSLDDALQTVTDEGYLFETGNLDAGPRELSHAHLLDLLDKESRGNKQYRLWHAPAPIEEEGARRNAIETHVRDELEKHEINPDQVDRETIDRTVQMIDSGEQSDALHAFERAVMERSEQDESHQRTRIDQFGEIPGWDVPSEPKSARDVGRSLPSAEGGRAEPGDRVGKRGAATRDAGARDREAHLADQRELAQREERDLFQQPLAILGQLGEQRNGWVDVPEGKIYLRRHGVQLDITNIRFDDDKQGTGAFTRYLNQMEQEAAADGIKTVRVENVENPRLGPFLERQGYRFDGATGGLSSFVKPIGRNDEIAGLFAQRAAAEAERDRLVASGDTGIAYDRAHADIRALNSRIYDAGGDPRGMPPGRGREFNQIGGIRAATADWDAADRAGQMLDEGASRDDVYKETGWFVGPAPENKLRFEIPDTDAKLIWDRVWPAGWKGDKLTLKDVLDAPSLYAAYPHLRDVDIDAGIFSAARGTYKPPGEEIPFSFGSKPAEPVRHGGRINISMGLSAKEALPIILHEIQHAIQHYEEHLMGGNPSHEGIYRGTEDELSEVQQQVYRRGKTARSNLESANRSVQDQRNEILADMDRRSHDQYFNLYGEAEARNTALRSGMTNEELIQKPPFSTLDVPEEKLIAEPEPVRPEPEMLMRLLNSLEGMGGDAPRRMFGGRMVTEDELEYELKSYEERVAMSEDALAKGRQGQAGHDNTLREVAAPMDRLRRAIAEFGSSELFQKARGKVRFAEGARPLMTLFDGADASTPVHEGGHIFLEDMMRFAEHPSAPEDLRQDARTTLDWLGVQNAADIRTRHHEKFARGFEQYVREGVAPSPGLARVFAQFKEWLLSIYQTLKGLGAPISEEMRGVYDRMLAAEPQRTVFAGERERQPSLADIHQADAREIEPHEAGAAADRISAERERAGQEPRQDIANEIAPVIERIEAESAASGTEPGAEVAEGDGGHGEMGPRGGGPEPIARGAGVGGRPGEVSAGRGGPAREGGGISGAATGPSRPGASDDAGAHPLAPSPADTFGAAESPFVDKAGNIRVENLTTRADVAQAIREAAAANNDFIGDRRGVVTDGQVMELADALGMDFAKLNTRKIGQSFNAEQIVAARKLLIQSATDVAAAMKKAAVGSDEDVMAYALAKDRHQMIQAQVAGITAEAGRALAAFRNIAGEGGEEAQAVDQFIRNATGKTLFQLRMEATLGARFDTPAKISKFLNDASQRTFGRMVLEYWINGLISGTATHTTYAIGNELLLLTRAVPETAVAAAIGAAREAMGRPGERVRGGEVGSHLLAMARSFPASLQAAIEGARTGMTTLLPGETAHPLMPFLGDTSLITARNLTNAPVGWAGVQADVFSLLRGLRDGLVCGANLVAAGGHQGAPLLGFSYSPLGQIPDIAYRGVPILPGLLPGGTMARLPGRLIAAIHSFFRTSNYSVSIAGEAFRRAQTEGRSGNALAARVADLRQNPSPEMMERSRGEATAATLMGQSGGFTQLVSRLTNHEIIGSLKIPGTNLDLGGWPLLKFVDPFVHIAGAIMDQTIMHRTPVGILAPEIRADILGRNGNIAQDTAMARMMCGTALAVTVGGLAAQGLVSGSGPSDPKESATWRLAGNQAHSVRIGNMWYQVNHLGPMGMLVGIAADMYDVAHTAEKGDFIHAAAMLQHAFTQNILDESFMRGPSELIQAVEDPGRYGDAYIRNFISSFVPFSVGMAQIARASDPFARETRTVMDAILAKVPGMSETLFPRRDVWGEPIPSRDALIAAGVTAIYAQQISRDPVNLAMEQLGVYPAQIERRIRNVPLTEAEYDDYSRLAGRMAKLRLDTIVRSPDFAQWSAHAKHDVMADMIAKCREAAIGVMFGIYPRIAAEATKVRAQKAGAP